MNGVSVDLNHISLWEALDRFEIQDKIGCFYKVLGIFEYTLKLENLNKPQ